MTPVMPVGGAQSISPTASSKYMTVAPAGVCWVQMTWGLPSVSSTTVVSLGVSPGPVRSCSALKSTGAETAMSWSNCGRVPPLKVPSR